MDKILYQTQRIFLQVYTKQTHTIDCLFCHFNKVLEKLKLKGYMSSHPLPLSFLPNAIFYPYVCNNALLKYVVYDTYLCSNIQQSF